MAVLTTTVWYFTVDGDGALNWDNETLAAGGSAVGRLH